MVNLPAGVYEVSGSHTYASAGAYTINLTVTDDDGGSDWKTLVYNIVDVDAGPDGFINEGSTFTSAGSFTCSASGLYTATVDYGDGSGPQPLSLSPGYVFDLSHQYVENGMYTVLVTIFKDGAAFISDSALVTVYNVAPVITSFTGSPTSPVILGVEINLAGVFTDPGVMDSHIAVIQWGDGQTMTVNLPVGVYQVSGSHTYASAGVYTITLTVTDDDGGSDSKTLGYDIVVVDAGPDGFINEGSMFTSAGSFSCSGGGLYTATVDYGDGSGPQPLSLSPGYLFDLSHQYVDNGIYIVQVTIFKDAVAFISDSVIVTVYNVAPIITSLSGPPTNPIRIGNAIYLLGVFTDPGVLDSHVVLIEWGDTQTTTVNLPAGVYQVNRSHTYASVGVYTITLTVTDKDGGFDTKSIETYVVVYDPICGFVTGGGWGLIPVGSYPANPDLGGRVNFGFVAKYKKGCYIPEGNTEFQFQVGDMNFHSHVYQWLIITGPKATYQGNGTINGQGHYGFRFTVIDGKISGGGGVDKFRMKIWDKDNDNQIIFDNDMGAPDDQDPSTPLSGGQITIHNK
jgi:PKD repeat protein